MGLLLILLLLVAPATGKVLPDCFKNKTLRIDLYHIGRAGEESYILDEIKEEGAWSSGPALEPFDLGDYRAILVDPEKGKTVFRRGFCTIFREWQTTAEAKKQRRVFHESIRVPYPAKKLVFKIQKRTASGFRDLFRLTLDPSRLRPVREKSFASARVFQIHKTGPPQKRVDIVLLSEGYSLRDGDKFIKDAERVATVLLSTEPYSRYRNLLNIWAVFFPSASGVDEPLKGIYKETALQASFNALNIPRYMLTFDNKRVRDLASHAPYDTILIMVNTSRYGGGGIFRQYAIFASDNLYTPYLMLHEMGHAFAGLGDEYFSSYVTYQDFYPEGMHPWEPNISDTAEADKIKWKSLLTPGIPLPTPALEKYRGKVGAFEGAGYVAKGLYRPSLDCIMRLKGWVPFCRVCSAAIEKMVLFLAGELANR